MSDETEGQAPSAGEDQPAEEPKAEEPKTPEEIISKAVEEQKQSAESHHTPGTVVLTFVFLLTFAVYYFANWKALADVWHVR